MHHPQQRWLTRFRAVQSVWSAARGSRRRGKSPQLEALENRLNPSTYYWTALGDAQTWNDPMNWAHFVPYQSMAQTGVPTPYSDVVFPAISTLPKGALTTINFNFSYLFQPLDSLSINDSYTFEGTPVTIEQSLSVSNPFTSSSTTTAIMELSGLAFAPGATINTAAGTTLQLGTTSAPTGLQLNLQGALTKTGGGQVEVDTQTVTYPTTALNLTPVPVTIGGGSVTLGENVTLSAINVQINSTASLNIADDVAAQVRSITGTGLIDLEGTTTAGDTTSLSVAVPNSVTDQFGGFIQGTGRFITSGNGTLTTGTITMNGTGSIDASSGTLLVDGSISAGALNVGIYGTFGGLGIWNFSGAVVFQAGATFQVTLDGTAPGSQYTQLVDSNATSGVNLGNSTLAAVIGYGYEQGDQFTIISSPLVQGAFQNVFAGRTVLGGVPFAVASTATSIVITPLQSVTATQLSSSANPTNPGVPVRFTATVNTRTAPVGTGTVTFMEGTTALGTVAVGTTGAATLTTTTLPVGGSSISAVYNGAGGNLNSTSPSLTQVVVPFTTVTSVASAANPSVFGQAVTFTASVVAAGAPVTAGTVTFRHGSQFLGSASLDSSGVATLSVSSLPAGKNQVQAVFVGTATNLSSVSALWKQTVVAAPTVTTITLTTETQANGTTRYVLVATVTPGTAASTALVTGTVVFRKNGSVIGKAKLKAGVAVLSIGRKPPRGKFVAALERSSNFKASTSPPLVLQA
jgi:hypothetical protein